VNGNQRKVVIGSAYDVVPDVIFVADGNNDEHFAVSLIVENNYTCHMIDLQRLNDC